MKRSRLNPVSKKRREQIKNLTKIRHEQTNDQKGKCFFCGKQTILDQVHIIRRSASLALIDNPENIVMGCRSDHQLFDDNVKEWAIKFPQLVDIIYNRMIKLDKLYAERWIMKIKN